VRKEAPMVKGGRSLRSIAHGCILSYKLRTESVHKTQAEKKGIYYLDSILGSDRWGKKKRKPEKGRSGVIFLEGKLDFLEKARGHPARRL